VYRPKNNGHPAFAEYARLLSSFKVIAKLELLTTPPANSRHPEILTISCRFGMTASTPGRFHPRARESATAIEQLTSPDTGFLAASSVPLPVNSFHHRMGRRSWSGKPRRGIPAQRQYFGGNYQVNRTEK